MLPYVCISFGSSGYCRKDVGVSLRLFLCSSANIHFTANGEKSWIFPAIHTGSDPFQAIGDLLQLIMIKVPLLKIHHLFSFLIDNQTTTAQLCETLDFPGFFRTYQSDKYMRTVRLLRTYVQTILISMQKVLILQGFSVLIRFRSFSIRALQFVSQVLPVLALLADPPHALEESRCSLVEILSSFL